MNNSIILLIHCPDKTGIIAAVTNFIKEYKGNIIYLDQYVDIDEKKFFMRVEWELDKFQISRERISQVFNKRVAYEYGMSWELYFTGDKNRMAIFVSKMTHCLYDILSRYKANEWIVEIPLIISNHKENESICDKFDIPFHHVHINSENKIKQEMMQLELLKSNQIDFIVLARYMQVLSKNFVDEYSNRIINIHHSFLPAFPGSKPYHSAYKKGVKIIGATSHFVTQDLDEGPIIEQDVVRVSHLDSVSDMVRKGKDLEKIVLSRAIYYYLERKILVYNNKTIVFS